MNLSTRYKLLMSILITLPLLLFSIQGSAKEVLASQGSAKEVLTSGQFIGASDHITSGNVEIIKTEEGHVLVLGSDFSLDGAPDPKVGFGKSGEYDAKAEVSKLQSKVGEQRYLIPASIDISSYDEVYIWCDKFSVPLGVAQLK